MNTDKDMHTHSKSCSIASGEAEFSHDPPPPPPPSSLPGSTPPWVDTWTRSHTQGFIYRGGIGSPPSHLTPPTEKLPDESMTLLLCSTTHSFASSGTQRQQVLEF